MRKTAHPPSRAIPISPEIRVKPRGRVEVVRTVLCAVREPHRDCADHSRALTLKTLPIIPEIRLKPRSWMEVARTVLCAVRQPHRECAGHSRAFTLKALPI